MENIEKQTLPSCRFDSSGPSDHRSSISPAFHAPLRGQMRVVYAFLRKKEREVSEYPPVSPPKSQTAKSAARSSAWRENLRRAVRTCQKNAVGHDATCDDLKCNWRHASISYTSKLFVASPCCKSLSQTRIVADDLIKPQHSQGLQSHLSSHHKMVLEIEQMFDECRIRSLLIRERYYRDSCQWERMRDAFHPDTSKTWVNIQW